MRWLSSEMYRSGMWASIWISTRHSPAFFTGSPFSSLMASPSSFR